MEVDNNINNGRLLELLELYMDLVEKQDVAIYHMSKVIRRQEEELQHVRNLYRLEAQDLPGLADDRREAGEALKDYERARGNEEGL